ncbi:sensor histidine kinase [Sphingomonas sp. Tas61C01]|uniref:sensor histidine kinase n=1 Tax=Sphingomonas sp. Tas61C01 TaxID=3458297 RepID=UPI00403E6EAA
MVGSVVGRLKVSEGRFGRVLVAFMATALLLLIAAAVAIAWINGRNQAYTAAVVHTQDVRQAISNVQVALEQSETARRGYLLAPGPVFAEAYGRTSRTLFAGLSEIGQLTRDNANQIRRVNRILPLLGAFQKTRMASVSLAATGDLQAARAAFASDTSVLLTRAIRYRLKAMADEETRLLAMRSDLQRSATFWFYVVSGIAAVLLALVVVLTLLVVLHNTRALTASRDMLRDFADTLEEQVAERTADLSRANEEIQRFAYIVSHDLRSPLVNVMGFTAELAEVIPPLTELIERAEATVPDIVTSDARGAVREDLPEAIGFIRASTQKMDRLINAILKLSREGRRTIAPEQLDPAAVVDSIAASIRHVIDERGVTLSIERPLPTIVTDRVALEQILSNLIENATKYGHPDRAGTIAVSGSEARGRVTIAIADNGRGIAPGDHQRIFDLFRRAGAQDQPGEGIGLAHVRALAHRLGGTIDVESELGQGSTFRLTLPKTFQIQEQRP